MNAKLIIGVRTLAITVLLAIGVATTIASGGGGSGGDGSIGPVQPPSDLLAITGDNARDTSSALIVAVGLTFDISEITGAEIQGSSVSGSSGLLKLMRADDLVAKLDAIAATQVESCFFAGSVTVTSTLADPNTLSVGDNITAVFVSCDDGQGYVINGEVDITVSAIQGDLFTDVFLLGLDVTMTAVEITEGLETYAVDGDIALTIDTLGFPVIVESMGGTQLRFDTGIDVMTFTGFDHVFQVDFGTEPETVLVTVDGRLDSALMGGAVIYETTVPIEAFGDDDPHTGQILITGANDSTVRIVVNDSTSVTLEVDTNGDGAVDVYIDTTFAELTDDSSGTGS